MTTSVNNNPPLQVVLADDDAEDCLIFSDAIKELRIVVDLATVSNGELLMQLLNKYIPDLLFLDIHMPCKDGKQCIREIRANPALDKLPVIVYSGMGQQDTIAYFFREGANHFLLKPTTMDDLKYALEIIFNNFSGINYRA
ncbi:CheY-like chemotaxis protein [Filimonas zeae]|uniref:Response regulatory domain-containing protein n=1 Tax=Filimonas zeae TaxID=1737353 RepID=A0A917J1U3_9BACT|nr:response regulator [Filimonas zeae]MDR6340495.1 CheY-like chemotaxis protein [Filimonas zeae]GGH73013.1 hypothetical protein GCM10011379_34060 [Filimonas zeae]